MRRVETIHCKEMTEKMSHHKKRKIKIETGESKAAPLPL